MKIASGEEKTLALVVISDVWVVMLIAHKSNASQMTSGFVNSHTGDV